MLGTTDSEGEKKSQTSSVNLQARWIVWDGKLYRQLEESMTGMREERGLASFSSQPFPWSLTLSFPPQLCWLFFHQVWVDSLGPHSSSPRRIYFVQEVLIQSWRDPCQRERRTSVPRLALPPVK